MEALAKAVSTQEQLHQLIQQRRLFTVPAEQWAGGKVWRVLEAGVPFSPYMCAHTAPTDTCGPVT